MADSPNTTPMTEISRPVIEAEIELLIDLLDQLDADPDLESTEDEEPWLGAPEGFLSIPNWFGLNSQGNDDRESDDCELEDGHDEEPELGWTEMQARFNRYGFDDGYGYEPSLGSTNSMSQIYWSRGRGGDVEDEHDGREDDPDFEPQCEDEGAQCDDEGAIEYEGDPDEDKEHWYQGFPCYAGPCSPIKSMVTQAL